MTKEEFKAGGWKYIAIMLAIIAALWALIFCDIWYRAHGQTIMKTVVFTWNENTESDLAGYRIYGQQESFNGIIPNGMPYLLEIPSSANTATIQIDASKDWIFVLTAFDTGGLESLPSNECGLNLIPPGPPAGFGCQEQVTP